MQTLSRASGRGKVSMVQAQVAQAQVVQAWAVQAWAWSVGEGSVPMVKEVGGVEAWAQCYYQSWK
jgi:hypothetical protein